ncbi:MAG: endonuclease/exonuclease/phosphatase family protein [Pseudomonadota bacterium]|nr:endonuclease/exonuclease/phosphatase family protein [Pseudomonadota bacterium]
MWANVLLSAAIFAAGCCILASIVRLRVWPFSVAAELLEPALLGLAGCMLAACFAGTFLAAGAAFALFVVGAVALVVAIRAGTAPRIDENAALLRIAHANLLDSPKAAARFADWARNNGAELIAITEPPPGETEKLRPLFPNHPFSLQSDDTGRRRVVVFSKHALDPHESPDINVLAFSLRRRDCVFEIVCAHPTIPISPAFEARRDEVIGRAFAAAHSAQTAAVVIGDLNTTPTGPVLAAMRRAHGFRRAGVSAFSPTWMAPFFGLGLTLDHICVSIHCAVRSYKVGPFIGSDHRPIFAEIGACAAGG